MASVTQQINSTHKNIYVFFLINDWVEIPQHAIVQQQSCDEVTARQLQTEQGTSFGSASLEITTLPEQRWENGAVQARHCEHLPPSSQKPGSTAHAELLGGAAVDCSPSLGSKGRWLQPCLAVSEEWESNLKSVFKDSVAA